ncbi:hypothetical protein [Pseudobutyrivibrio sp.]|jgi:hypothetical protein|uniref:hypothetical protein n=1 Tax=Pseudobutyrivibrio sp. TaxID=2014367 RepID=UPI0025FF05D1|nr:hypothetical protein [Pseudobutyrivibrio sp.]
MYILFEEHQYDSNLVEKVLKDIYVLQDVDKKVSVQYVGYFYNPHLHDCVFVLPKVLLTEQDKLVGISLETGEDVSPEQVLTPQNQNELKSEYREFIYNFSVWIYRALSVYYKDNPRSKAILYKHLPHAGRGRRHCANTFLDIVLSLIDFNKENKDFVLFTIKNLHKGNNKVNWNRTISHSQAFIQGEDVLYMTPVNKKRIINYEEELFIIFYSILKYLNEEYGFHTPINIQYDLIKGKQFKQYLNGMGKIRLMQIKYKYFSDKALLLWDLCYAFFEKSYPVSINTNTQEYILAKNFNIVFEAMIDELIGEQKIPRGLKEQPDGKRVDHMYTYYGLTHSNDQDDKIYYIGDSKYYKAGHPLGRESVYKQYTYARNVIQWNIDLFMKGQREGWSEEEKEEYRLDKKDYGKIRLRDDEQDPLTEGYNVIPNFFISAFVDTDRKYIASKNIKPHEGQQTHLSYQFEDRLFDRDTLILSHYDVNFLYVLYLYARNKPNEKLAWREEVRSTFRDAIRDVLKSKYDFYALKSKGNFIAGEQVIKDNFKELQGKLYRPYGDKDLYSLALERREGYETKESDAYHILEDYFEIIPVELGENPKKDLDNRVEQYQLEHPYINIPQDWLPDYHVERYADVYFVVGMYHDKEHWEWITGNNDKGSLIYNVRLDKSREGALKQATIRNMRPRFAILYEEGHERENKYHVFRIHDYAVMKEERMRKAKYPTNHGGPKGSYFIFRFDEEVNIGEFDICRLIEDTCNLDSNYQKGSPIFPTGEILLNYRINK